MSNPNPGQVICPTCGRATPPAIFCTQCGEPLPASLRGRPPGMDRDSIDERIRERRGMDAPFRRGAYPDDREAASRGYVPFEPDPLDAAARRDPGASNVPPRGDFRQPEPEPASVPPPEPVAEAPAVIPEPEPEPMPVVEQPAAEPAQTAEESAPEPQPAAEPVLAAEPEPMAGPVPPAEPAAEPVPEPAAQPEPEAQHEPIAAAEPQPPVEEPPKPLVEPAPIEPAPTPLVEPIAPRVMPEPAPGYVAPRYVAPLPPAVAPPSVAWSEEDDRPWTPAPADQYQEPSGGVSGLVVGAFIALGLVAVIGGALLAGVLGPGTANASPTPTLAASVAPSVEGTPQPTPSVEATASVEATPAPTLLPPGVFPDGFTAQVQPCLERPNNEDGCASSGTEVTIEVWVWVSFRHGNDNDVVLVTLFNASNSPVGDADYALVDLDCGPDCGGWLYFRFPSLSAGEYRIQVDRNGDYAAETTFTATG